MTHATPIPDRFWPKVNKNVRACVNPDHLEPVTAWENQRRGGTFVVVNKAKTHCPQGHAYDEENTRWYEGRRYCRACARDTYLRRKALGHFTTEYVKARRGLGRGRKRRGG